MLRLLSLQGCIHNVLHPVPGLGVFDPELSKPNILTGDAANACLRKKTAAKLLSLARKKAEAEQSS